MNTQKPLSWNPVRRGAIYCAPACGHGCTYENYLKAHADSGRLCKRLGEGWIKEVWENLGWHFMASKGDCHVYKNSDHVYWASLETKLGQFTKYARTPRAAVDGIVKTITEVQHMALALNR